MLRTSSTLASVLPLVVFAAGCTQQVSQSEGQTHGPSTQGSSHGSPAGCTVGTTESCTQTDGEIGARTCQPGQNGAPAAFGACSAVACKGSSFACTLPDGTSGLAQCIDGQSASGCGTVDQCSPGETQTISNLDFGPNGCTDPCILQGGVWEWDPSACDTPLVLAFHDERVAFTQAAGAFDLSGEDASIGTDWVSAETPWLALDRDGNGSIDDGRELFGSMTELPGGRRAVNGFEALAALDHDGDGAITARDAAFHDLLLWRDVNQDRRSDPSELVRASDAGLVAIRLDWRTVPRCDDGDCEIERARFVFRDASAGGAEREGSVVDVHLARR